MIWICYGDVIDSDFSVTSILFWNFYINFLNA